MAHLNKLALAAVAVAVSGTLSARTLTYPGWTGSGADNCYTNTANWNQADTFTNLDNVPRIIAEKGKTLDISLPDFELYNPAVVFTLRGTNSDKITLNGQGHTFSMPAPKDKTYPHVYEPRTVTFAAGKDAYTSPKLVSVEVSNKSEEMLKPVFSWTDADITFERSPAEGGRLLFKNGTYDFSPEGVGAQTFIINDGYVETRSDVRFLNATTRLPSFDFRGSATNGYCMVSGGVWTVSGEIRYGYQFAYYYPGTNLFHFTGGVKASMVGNNMTTYFGKPEGADYRHQIWLVEGEGTEFDMRGQGTFAFRGDSNLIISNGATFVIARYTQMGCGKNVLDKPTVMVEGSGTQLLGAPTYNNPTSPTYCQFLVGHEGKSTGVLTVNDGLVSGVPEYPDGLQITLGNNAGSTGVFNLNGGEVRIGGGNQNESFYVGKEGVGTFTQTDGALVCLKRVHVCNKNDAAVSGTMNLNGGVFEAVQLLGKYGTSESGVAQPVLTADGGTLKVRYAWNGKEVGPFTPYLSGFNSALLGANGLTFDLDGKVATVTQTFGNKAGEEGVLTVTGGGTLTLSGAQTVSDIVVESGTLALADATNEWTSALALRPGTTLSLAGTPKLLKVGGFVATNTTIVLDPKDAIEIDGTLELSGLTLSYVTAPSAEEVSTLFTCKGQLSAATAKALRRAVSVLQVAGGMHAAAEVTYDAQTGKTRVDVCVRPDLSPIGPEGTTTWQSDGTTGWTTPGSWSAGVPLATNKAGFTSASAAKDVTVPAGTAVGALTFADTGYRLSGGDLEIAAEKGAAEIAVTAGAHEIASPLMLDTTVSVPVTAGAALTLSGMVTSDGFLTTSGNGLLTLGGGISSLGLSLGGGTVAVTNEAVAAASSAGDIALACVANEAATVLKTDTDLSASSINATAGVLVKRGVGTLTVDVASGKTTRLANTTSGPDPGTNGRPATTDVQSFSADGASPTAGVGGFTIAEGEVRFDGSAAASVPTFSAGGSVLVGMNVDACDAQPTLTLDHAYFNARDNQPGATHFWHGWRAGVTGNATVSPVIRVLNGATLYCDTYKGGPDAVSPARPLMAITNGTLTSSYASSLSLCTPNGGATMVFRCKDAKIYAGNNTVKPIQISGNIDFEGENTVLAALGGALGGVKLDGYSKGRVYLHDGGLFHADGFNFTGALVHDITFAFNNTEWRGADKGSYSITNGPAAANGHLFVEMVGKGAIFNPGAGNAVTTEMAFSGEGGLQVQSGTFRFLSGTYGYAGTTLVSAGATVDLSAAGKLAAARFGGDGTVSGGSFDKVTVDPGTTDGTIETAPTFAGCSAGRIRIDLGLPKDHEWTRPYPTGLVVAHFTGTVPSAGQFSLVNAGRNMGGKFTVANDGTVTMDVVQEGFAIIVR